MHLKNVVEQSSFNHVLLSSQEADTLPALRLANCVTVRKSFQKPPSVMIEEVKI